jgi:hypothetical protein
MGSGWDWRRGVGFDGGVEERSSRLVDLVLVLRVEYEEKASGEGVVDAEVRLGDLL